jgi:hypothetical protein
MKTLIMTKNLALNIVGEIVSPVLLVLRIMLPQQLLLLQQWMNG